MSRNFHALVTKYNVLFNGNEALKKGVEELRISYSDNFWEVLPLERLDISDEMMMPGDKKNPNFERAENKAVKAIQKHSINVNGYEHNYQIDEAYFTLGKARYFDQRFLPALEAFNYVLYKYPNSSEIDEIKVWREKTNMRLGNNAMAIQNVNKILTNSNLKKRVALEAEMVLAQSFINDKEFDSALVHVKRALRHTKLNENKARLRYIKAQLFEKVNKGDSALAAYQQVVKMNRKSPKSYFVYAHANSLPYFDLKNGDRIAEETKYLKLAADFENKKHLGILYYQMANHYIRIGDEEKGIAYYNKSLKEARDDKYLRSMNYRSIASLNFDKGEFIISGKYFDSTLVNLEEKTRDHRLISKKRKNLDDVIKYEKLAIQKDSILRLVKMDSLERQTYFKSYVEKLKKDEADLQAKKEKATKDPVVANLPQIVPSINNPSGFYFYNPRLVQIGKADFRKKWGEIALKDNWRYVSENNNQLANTTTSNLKIDRDTIGVVTVVDPKYDLQQFITKIPKDSIVIDSITKERDYAYFQLGMIYKDKYKKYDLAEKKYNSLLSFNPDQKYVLPVLYNLYKIYLAKKDPKAAEIKNKIITVYPQSRHAQLLSNESIATATDTPEALYKNLKQAYDKGQYDALLLQSEEYLIQLEGDPIVPKIELLKAYALGKVEGVTSYKKALSFVALNYPNEEEGKKAEALLQSSVLKLEQQEFETATNKEMKIVFEYKNSEDELLKADLKNIQHHIEQTKLGVITHSIDVYTKDKKMLVLHGFSTRIKSDYFLETLLKDKKLKFTKKGISISNHNYKVVQINKNLDVYIEQLKKKS